MQRFVQGRAMLWRLLQQSAPMGTAMQVMLTHGHPDHVNGLLVDPTDAESGLNFPNAIVRPRCPFLTER